METKNIPLKTGDRVQFEIEYSGGITGPGTGVVTRLAPNGAAMMQPDKFLPGGARISNIRRAEVKRG